MVPMLVAAALILVAINLVTAFASHGRHRLASLSRAMAWITTGAAMLAPVAIVATFLAPSATAPLNLRLYHLSAGAMLSETVPIDDRMLALGCAAVPVAIVVWGLWSLRRLFLLFAAGEIFAARTSRLFASLGLAVFLFVGAAFVVQAPISYFLTRADGHAVVALSLGLEDLLALFAAAVTAVVARVMSEATNVAEENAGFV